MFRRVSFAIAILLATLNTVAEQVTPITSSATRSFTRDTVTVHSPLYHPDSIALQPRETSLIKRIVRYFEESNIPKKEKPIDFSFIGGPAYSSDTKLSVALIGSALYRSHFGDSLTPVSDATLYAEAAITGFAQIGLRGTHICERDWLRTPYDVSFEYYPTYYWGIGYESDSNDANKTKYVQLNADVKASAELRLMENFYIGPAVHFHYAKAFKTERPEMWGDESRSIYSYGIGFNLTYDSRDFIPNPYSGWYASLEQRLYPGVLQPHNEFASTEITVNNYNRVWRGGVIAAQIHGQITYGDTPWSMLASFGGSHSMRGYYKNRYRDKCGVDMTVELRQHVWNRNSIVVWVGAGNVFPTFKEFKWRQTLPDFGVGYRWEFKKRVNVRLDIGFGKGEKDIIFNINEVF